MQANSLGGETSAEACDELQEELKGQKRVFKRKLTKLYSRLVRLLSKMFQISWVFYLLHKKQKKRGWKYYKFWEI